MSFLACIIYTNKSYCRSVCRSVGLFVTTNLCHLKSECHETQHEGLAKFTVVVGELGIQHLCTNERKEKQEVQKRPNRRQVQKGVLRATERNLKTVQRCP